MTPIQSKDNRNGAFAKYDKLFEAIKPFIIDDLGRTSLTISQFENLAGSSVEDTKEDREKWKVFCERKRVIISHEYDRIYVLKTRYI